MLATRVRIACSIVVGAVVAIGLFVARERPVERSVPPIEEKVVDRCGAAPQLIYSTDTIDVTLHEVPERTGVDVESDWSKTFRMVWDGPIRSWTTMRQVRVPSLDHRMIDSIEPAEGRGARPRDERAIRVKVRVVVPGDLEAALEWIRANPAVATANVEVVSAY